jgi:hypothetical protein
VPSPVDINSLPGETLPKKICKYLNIDSLQKLQKRTILIQIDGVEKSYPINIVSPREKSEDGNDSFILVITEELLGFIINKDSFLLSRFKSKKLTTKILPFTKVAIFFSDKVIVFNGS